MLSNDLTKVEPEISYEVLKLSGIHNIQKNTLTNYLSSLVKGIPNLLPPGAINIRIHKFSKIHGGLNDTYRFRLSFQYGKRNPMLNLILKFYTEEKIAKREYLTLRALERVNFPVPQVYVLETDEQILGSSFIIMEEVKGKNMHNYLKYLNKEETLNLIERFAEALVNLHELKIDEMDLNFLEFPENKYDYAERQALRKEESERLTWAQNFEWAKKWLENNALKCPCNRYSLLHVDMNLKNFLITDTGRIVFLDWTWTEIGDPLKDVGYAYHSIREVFGSRNVNKKGAQLAAYFLKQYVARSNRNIDNFALQFYLFSAGLRGALYLKDMVEKLAFPSTTLRVFGLKFVPLFPFVWLHFKSKYKRLKRLLREIASDYEQAMFGTLGGKILSSMELNDVLSFLGPERSELILDVGTGSSRIARKIVLNTKANVVGIDVGRSNIISAKKRAGNLGLYEMVLADGQNLPFKESSFDGVICIRALKYFPNYNQGIAEMSRVLKTGKTAVLDLSSLLGYEVFFRYITHSLNARGSHVFNPYKMRKLFKLHNFRLVDSVPLQKIPHKMWNLTTNMTILKVLIITENILKKITPSLLSRSVLLKCVKE